MAVKPVGHGGSTFRSQVACRSIARRHIAYRTIARRHIAYRTIVRRHIAYRTIAHRYMSLTILKIGGQVLAEPTALSALLADFAALAGPKVLVHGGGRAATDLAKRLGVEAPLIDGRRITSQAMLEVAVMVYGGLMNRQLVAALQSLGQQALGLTGADLDVIRARKRPAKPLDYGFVGDIEAVDVEALHELLAGGKLPVLAPLTHDGQGQLLNTNADTIASSVARALSDRYAVDLVFAFERPGVLLDPLDDTSVVHRLDTATFAHYRQSGEISGGMLPKLDNAFAALEAGVQRVFICQPAAIGQLGKEGYPGTVLVG